MGCISADTGPTPGLQVSSISSDTWLLYAHLSLVLISHSSRHCFGLVLSRYHGVQKKLACREQWGARNVERKFQIREAHSNLLERVPTSFFCFLASYFTTHYLRWPSSKMQARCIFGDEMTNDVRFYIAPVALQFYWNSMYPYVHLNSQQTALGILMSFSADCIWCP